MFTQFVLHPPTLGAKRFFIPRCRDVLTRHGLLIGEANNIRARLLEQSHLLTNAT
jgi:hypothetical protein